MLKGSFLKTKELVEWWCVTFLVWHYCDISASTRMYGTVHGVTGKSSCIGCTMTGGDMISNQLAYERSLRELM